MDRKRTTNNLRGRNRKSVSLSQTIGPSSPVSCLWNSVSIWHFRLSWDNKTFSSTLCNISAWQQGGLNTDCFPLPSVPWMWIWLFSKMNNSDELESVSGQDGKSSSLVTHSWRDLLNLCLLKGGLELRYINLHPQNSGCPRTPFHGRWKCMS